MNMFTLATKGVTPLFSRLPVRLKKLLRSQTFLVAAQKPFQMLFWFFGLAIAIILSGCALFPSPSKAGEETIALPPSIKTLAVDAQGFRSTIIRVRSEDRADIYLTWEIKTSIPMLKEKAEQALDAARIEKREEGGFVYRIRGLSYTQGAGRIDLECSLDLLMPAGLGLQVEGNQIDIEGSFRSIESKGGRTKIFLKEQAEYLSAEALFSPLVVEGDADRVLLRTIASCSLFPENVDISLKTSLRGNVYSINSAGSIKLLIPQDATGLLNAPQGTKIGISFKALSPAKPGRVVGYLNGADGRIINLEAGKEAALRPLP